MYLENGEGKRIKLVLPMRATVCVAQYSAAFPYVIKYENVTNTFGTWTSRTFHLFHSSML